MSAFGLARGARRLRHSAQTGDSGTPRLELSAAIELLSRVGTLAMLRELQAGPGDRSSVIARCDVAPDVAADRRRELTAAGLVEHGDDGSDRLTASGSDLDRALAPLEAWAKRWRHGTR